MMTFQQTLNALQSVKIQVVGDDLRIYGELSPLLQDAVNYWRVNLVELCYRMPSIIGASI